ncbi:MAG TPA: L,D-transpeptidase [Legionellaceae bacterium]|nr:L,D-transpeptidase [Legionellaceae bacterium]
MKRSLMVMSSVGLMLSACTTMDGGRSIPIVDDGGHTHYTLSMDADQKGSSYFPLKRQATGHKVFIFDPKATAWAAYDAQGNRVETGSASGGRDYCDDIGRPCRTVTGKYHVYSKKGEDCTSSIYPVETHGGAKMPYCMHFNGGYSIHAAYEVPNYNASHGCIRVLPAAAKWLNEDFVDIGTTVIVEPY